VLRTLDRRDAIQQAVYPQRGRKFVSIHDTTFPAFQAGNQAISRVMNFWFMT